MAGNRRVIDGDRHFADIPFKSCKVAEVPYACGFGTLRKESRKRSAVFRDTWSLWRMLTNETRGGLGEERSSEQPPGCRELDQKSFDEARTVIPLMHGQAFPRVMSAKEERLNRP